VYSIGKILFEAIEGKLTDKVRPLKQARLSNPDTDFRAALNRIVMDATAEDPKQRIASARELKERLTQILYCQAGPLSEAARFSKTTPAMRMFSQFNGLHGFLRYAAAIFLEVVVNGTSLYGPGGINIHSRPYRRFIVLIITFKMLTCRLTGRSHIELRHNA
jgi:hypothetical protein